MDGAYFTPSDTVKAIIERVKSEGIFDDFRKECIADVDTKPAYQNLRQRVEDYVGTYLSSRVWAPDLNKNALRESLRAQINQSNFLKSGVERVISQVVTPRVDKFLKPKIEAVVAGVLGIDPNEDKKTVGEQAVKAQQLAVPSSSALPDTTGSLYSFNLLEPPPPLPTFVATGYPPQPPLPPASPGQKRFPPLPAEQPPPPPSDDDMDISDEEGQADSDSGGRLREQSSHAQQTLGISHSSASGTEICQGDSAYLAGETAPHHRTALANPADAAALVQGLAEYMAIQDGDVNEQVNSECTGAHEDELGSGLVSYEDGTSDIGEEDGGESFAESSACESSELGQKDDVGGMEHVAADSLLTFGGGMSGGRDGQDLCSGAVFSPSADFTSNGEDMPTTADTANQKASSAAVSPVSGRRESRRNRTRNRKYTSGEFTSIFSQKRQLLCDGYSGDVIEEGAMEEVVVTTEDALVANPARPDHSTAAEGKEEEVAKNNDEMHQSQLPSSRIKEDSTACVDDSSSHLGSRPGSANSHESSSSHPGRAVVRSKSDSGCSTEARHSSSATRTATQRYDASDLYKPRVSHRKPVECPVSPSSLASQPHPPAAGLHRRKRAHSGEDLVVRTVSEGDLFVSGLQSLEQQSQSKRARKSTAPAEALSAHTENVPPTDRGSATNLDCHSEHASGPASASSKTWDGALEHTSASGCRTAPASGGTAQECNHYQEVVPRQHKRRQVTASRKSSATASVGKGENPKSPNAQQMRSASTKAERLAADKKSVRGTRVDVSGKARTKSSNSR